MENIAELHEKVYAHLTTKYPDLTFSLRKINRGGRLEAGYWLYGAEWYVRFSFWDSWIEGSNQLTLNLTIYLDNPTALWLEFHLHHNEKVHHFRNKVASVWGMQSNDHSFNIYKKLITKLEDNDDITKTLDRFIQQDKMIIDTFIKSENMNVFFPSFDRENFFHYKGRIESYRKNLSYKLFTAEKYTYKSIQINNITLENITCIAPINIEFHRNTKNDKKQGSVTCFIGLNGTSKTTLLRAVVLGLVGSDFVRTVDLNNLVSITERENEIFYAETATIKTQVFIKGKVIDSELIKFRSENNTIPTIFQKEDTILVADENYLHTLVLAFAQERGGATLEKDESIKDDKPNIYDFLSLLKNSTDNRFEIVSEWILNIQNDIFGDRYFDNKTSKNTPKQQALKLIFDIISEITSQIIAVERVNYQKKHVWISINGKTELLGLASQGFENLFGWIGVLVKRLYEIQPNTAYKNLTDIPAIVLIDEIDTYLHISVQQKILAVLVEKFPNIQFIVTTHSPYTIGSIPNDKIKIYTCKKEGESVEVEEFTDFNAFGADIKELSKRISDIERPSTTIELAFKELFNLLDELEENPYNTVLETNINAKIENIEKQIHHSDPELLEAKNKLILIKILNEKEEGSAV